MLSKPCEPCQSGLRLCSVVDERLWKIEVMMVKTRAKKQLWWWKHNCGGEYKVGSLPEKTSWWREFESGWGAAVVLALSVEIQGFRLLNWWSWSCLWTEGWRRLCWRREMICAEETVDEGGGHVWGRRTKFSNIEEDGRKAEGGCRTWQMLFWLKNEVVVRDEMEVVIVRCCGYSTSENSLFEMVWSRGGNWTH